MFKEVVRSKSLYVIANSHPGHTNNLFPLNNNYDVKSQIHSFRWLSIYFLKTVIDCARAALVGRLFQSLMTPAEVMLVTH